MDNETQKALEDLRTFIEEKRNEYKDVKGMEGLLKYINECCMKIDLRVRTGEADADWLNAVRSDISRIEYTSKAEAGLLSPEEAEARRKRMEFFNSKPDLPDWVK